MKKLIVVVALLACVSVGFGQMDRFKNRIDNGISPMTMAQANSIIEKRDSVLNKDNVCVYPFYVFDQDFDNITETRYLDYSFLGGLQAKKRASRDISLYPAELMLTDKQGNLICLFPFSYDRGGALSKTHSMYMGKLNDEGDTDVLLSQMSGYLHDYRQAAADMVRSILNDSILDVTELRGWLANMNDIASDREIVSTYMAEGDFNTAFSLANMLPSLYELEGDELDEHDDYMDMLGLYRDLYNDGRNTMKLDSTEVAMVETIALNSKGTPKFMAQSILEGVFDYHYDECPEVDAPMVPNRKGMTEAIDSQLLSQAMGLNIDVKPNPATTWVAIDFTLSGDAKDATLVLTSTMGVKVLQTNLNGSLGQKVLDLRDFADGVYMLTVQCGEYSRTEKLVITK